MADVSHNVIDYWLYARTYLIRLWMKILYRGQVEDRGTYQLHRGVIISSNVWIVIEAAIFDGVRIGDDMIVAVGSIVNRDVLPHTIEGGGLALQLAIRAERSYAGLPGETVSQDA